MPVEIACSKEGTNTTAVIPFLLWHGRHTKIPSHVPSIQTSVLLGFTVIMVSVSVERHLIKSSNAILKQMCPFCLTYNKDKRVTEVGGCIFTNIKTNKYSSYTVLLRSLSELDDFMCGKLFNRTGTLCGKCKDGHYPLVYSFDMNCIQCPNGKANWWKYLLAAYLPLTIFYLVVLLFKINVASSSLYPFVFYMLKLRSRFQLVDQQTSQMAVRWVELLYGIWSLDFF